METLPNFWRNNFVPCHWFKTDGLINLSAMHKTQGCIWQAAGPTFHRCLSAAAENQKPFLPSGGVWAEWAHQLHTVQGEAKLGSDLELLSPAMRRSTTLHCQRQAADPSAPRFLKSLFGHMLTPKTEWWGWNKSPGKQHATEQSLNLYTLPFLAPQAPIGSPSLLSVYMVRTSDFTWHILIYCLLQETLVYLSQYIYGLNTPIYPTYPYSYLLPCYKSAWGLITGKPLK